MKMVRTRFAPSPTGFFHIGNLRTVLYSYALANKFDGQFILRIEDTDQNRFVEGAEQYIIDVLNDFELKPDEGPVQGGPHEPYKQSQRLDVYKKYAQKLVDMGIAYHCDLKGKELEKLQDKYRKNKDAFRSPNRNKNIEKSGDTVIRYKMPSNKVVKFECGLQGKMEFNTDDVDDWVMIKSDGYPTYNFAVVVDDHLMKVSHVFRGFEFIPSIPKNALLYKAFGWEMPKFYHLPVLLDPEGGKMSKRKGAVSVKEFQNEGYLPEAILNFLMLLGWAPKNDREMFTLDEFIKEFSLERLNKANPVFNREKLLWFNGEYIRNLSLDKLEQRFLKWAEKNLQDSKLEKNINKDKNLSAKLELVQERSKLLADIAEQLEFFYKRMKTPDPSEVKGVKRYNRSEYKKSMEEYIEIIKDYDDDSQKWDKESWVADIRSLADKYEWKHGDMFMMIRIVICGSPFSPPLFESLKILGKEEVLERLKGFVK